MRLLLGDESPPEKSAGRACACCFMRKSARNVRSAASGLAAGFYVQLSIKSLDNSAGRVCRLFQKLAVCIGCYPSLTYCKNRSVSGVKKGQKAPHSVSFCSMYGGVLSYPVDYAGVAMRAKLGRDGTLCAPRASFVPSSFAESGEPCNSIRSRACLQQPAALTL